MGADRSDVGSGWRSAVGDTSQDQTQKAALLRLLDLQTAAELTSLSVSSLRRAIRLRRLACHHVGRCVRVSEADLSEFLTRCRRKARP